MIWLRQFRCPICGRVSLQTWAPTYGILNLPQSLADPGKGKGERECFVCASNLWFEMWLWKANLAKYLLPLPLPASWPASFGFIFSLAFVSLDISLLPLSDYFFFIFSCVALLLTNIFVFFFFFFFFVFCCALYLFHFYLFALWGCWFVEYVDDAVLFVKHAKRCFDSRTRAWTGQPQSGRSSLKTLTQSKVE